MFNIKAEEYNGRRTELNAEIDAYNKEIGAIGSDSKVETDKNDNIDQIDEKPVNENKDRKEERKR